MAAETAFHETKKCSTNKCLATIKTFNLLIGLVLTFSALWSNVFAMPVNNIRVVELTIRFPRLLLNEKRFRYLQDRRVLQMTN
jgi:hypothetical protein